MPVAVILGGALLALVPAAHAQAASCTANPIVCENQLPGTPQSVWDVSSNDPYIQGFADPFSVNVGGTINFKIESAASSYTIDIYRMGYYGGDGARLITSLTPNISVSQNQPACNTNTATGLVDCGNWGVSASWNVPDHRRLRRLLRAHLPHRRHQRREPDPVRGDQQRQHSDIVFMTSDETWQAYNDWGGYSLYTGTPPAALVLQRAGPGPRRPGQLQPARSRPASTPRTGRTSSSTPNSR